MPVQVRNTRQKQAIRDAFARAGRPLSPDEAQLEAAKSVKGISVATIYRNIHALLDEAWLSPVEIPGEPARYEVAGKGHHHHFQCVHCRRMYDLEGCTLAPVPEVPQGFELTGHELFLYGRCNRCVRPQARPKAKAAHRETGAEPHQRSARQPAQPAR